MRPISTDGYRLFLLSAFLSEHVAEVTIFIQKKANKNDKLGSWNQNSTIEHKLFILTKKQNLQQWEKLQVKQISKKRHQKSNQCQNALKKTQHISKKHNFCYLTIQKGFF